MKSRKESGFPCYSKDYRLIEDSFQTYFISWKSIQCSECNKLKHIWYHNFLNPYGTRSKIQGKIVLIFEIELKEGFTWFDNFFKKPITTAEFPGDTIKYFIDYKQKHGSNKNN